MKLDQPKVVLYQMYFPLSIFLLGISSKLIKGLLIRDSEIHLNQFPKPIFFTHKSVLPLILKGVTNEFVKSQYKFKKYLQIKLLA